MFAKFIIQYYGLSCFATMPSLWGKYSSKEWGKPAFYLKNTINMFILSHNFLCSNYALKFVKIIYELRLRKFSLYYIYSIEPLRRSQYRRVTGALGFSSAISYVRV